MTELITDLSSRNLDKPNSDSPSDGHRRRLDQIGDEAETTQPTKNFVGCPKSRKSPIPLKRERLDFRGSRTVCNMASNCNKHSVRRYGILATVTARSSQTVAGGDRSRAKRVPIWENFKARLNKLEKFLDLEKIKQEIKILEIEMSEPEFWQDREMAREKTKKLNDLKGRLAEWEKIKNRLSDFLTVAKLDQADQAINLRAEIEKEAAEIKKELEKFELLTFLNQPYDQNSVLLSIHAGAGGVDAQDWSEMLWRMYLRFCEKKKWPVRIIDESRGGEAGIKSATLEIEAPHAYGWLRGEAGVHRLVRISPFDAEKMRHTSFALVEVLPELEEVKIEINPDDLRIDTFLASGHGGQNVQKTETAVRIVHLPTKISVACQSERSQHQNKERAMKILKTKLFHFYSAKQEEEKERLRGEFKSASWGNQIRSYVLHPYKMVKDHRTGYETNEVEKVLDGELDEVIESYLKKTKDQK